MVLLEETLYYAIFRSWRIVIISIRSGVFEISRQALNMMIQVPLSIFCMTILKSQMISQGWSVFC